mmetsp:Transcript_39020/g.82053  ORF Transcript_39020/g.82053 Transcript_39020/m.82053 type:complete len:398 (+) Transcript_39020:123-1316(+)
MTMLLPRRPSSTASTASAIFTATITSVLILSLQQLLVFSPPTSKPLTGDIQVSAPASAHSTGAVRISAPASILSRKAGQVQRTPSSLQLQIDSLCPASSKVNSQNNHNPPTQLMQSQDIRDAIKYWYDFNCPRKLACTFASIGQHLLHLAIQRNETLLTLQVGAMDGKSNDPMYEMLVQEMNRFMYGRETFSTLVNWLPVMIEPVPINYEGMLDTYAEIARDKGLGCAVPINAAVSYTTTESKCPFCRVNTAEDAPQRCREIPDWQRLQIGTLDCDFSKRFFDTDFDLCVLQDPLPCSSIGNLLREKNVSPEHFAMLQIDIEGYEYILFDGFLKEVQGQSLPPIIHYEHKVMKEHDEQTPLNISSRLELVSSMLTKRGYVLHDEGEDYLAIRLDWTK